jgi:hypothetical protein
VAINPKVMTIHQLRYRITRATTKSHAEMQIVAHEDEVVGLQLAHRKSETMSLSLKSVFPDEFTLI